MESLFLGAWFLVSSIWASFYYLFATFHPHLSLHELLFCSIPLGQAVSTVFVFFVSGFTFGGVSLWIVLLSCILFTAAGIRYYRLSQPKMATIAQRGGLLDALLPSSQDPLVKIFFFSFIFFSYMILSNTVMADGSEFIIYGPKEEAPVQLAMINSFIHGINKHCRPWHVMSTLMSGAESGMPFMSHYQSAIFCLCGYGLQDSIVIPNILSGISLPALLYLFTLRFLCNRQDAAVAVLLTAFSGGIGFAAWIFEDDFDFGWNYVRLAGDRDLPWLSFLYDVLLPYRGALIGYSLFLSCVLLLWVMFANMNLPIPCTTLPKYILGNNLVSVGSGRNIAQQKEVEKDPEVHSITVPTSPRISSPASTISIVINRQTRKSFLVTAGIISAITPLFHPQAYAASVVLSMFLCVVEVKRIYLEPHYMFQWLAFHVTSLVFGYLQVVLCLRRPSVFQSWGTFGFHRIWNDSTTRNFILFWLEGLGLFVLLAVNNVKYLDSIQKKFYISAVGGTFLFGNLMKINPWPDGNVKFFYCCVMLASGVVARGLRKSYVFAVKKSLLGRRIFIILIFTSLLFSGVLAFFTEGGNKTVLYEKEDVVAAEWIKEHTKSTEVFLGSDRMFNFASMLAGRTMIYSNPHLLYRHGFDFSKRLSHMNEILKCDEKYTKRIKELHVAYIIFDDQLKNVNRVKPECLNTLGAQVIFKNSKMELLKITH